MTDHKISDAEERDTLHGTIAEMQRLHAEGSDHIWAYYSRNLVRPVALSQPQGGRGDRQPAVAELQQNRQHACETALEQTEQKRLRASGPAAGTPANQDVAGLFFYAQRTDLYLKGGGVIGMVLPHSVLADGPVRQVAQRRVAQGPSCQPP